MFSLLQIPAHTPTVPPMFWLALVLVALGVGLVIVFRRRDKKPPSSGAGGGRTTPNRTKNN